MTTAIITTIRQQLRKRWVRGIACLGLMLVTYVASAGQISGLAFSPFVNRTFPLDHRLQCGVIRFYEPVFIVAGSDWCPRLIPSFISFCMGTQRKAVAIELNQMARDAIGEARLERARQLAMFSEKLRVQYGIFDDRPELIIAEVKHRFADQVPLQSFVMTPDPIVIRWNELTCEDWKRIDGEILQAQGVTILYPDDIDWLVPESKDDDGDYVVCDPLQVSCIPEDDVTATPVTTYHNLGNTKLQCFEDRPDLILTDLDSVQSVELPAQRPFSVGVIDLRDEQDLSDASPRTRDQAPVYTFRVAHPELLLDESHIVQLQCSTHASDEDENARIFADVRNRIFCQKEFPRREDQLNVWSFSLGFNR
ncbi:MAG: hypothetical protein JWP89_4604 [Schlesneria sp.]|nr:hypothetical protein [Schlesneria sp.]